MPTVQYPVHASRTRACNSVTGRIVHEFHEMTYCIDKMEQ